MMVNVFMAAKILREVEARKAPFESVEQLHKRVVHNRIDLFLKAEGRD